MFLFMACGVRCRKLSEIFLSVFVLTFYVDSRQKQEAFHLAKGSLKMRTEPMNLIVIDDLSLLLHETIHFFFFFSFLDLETVTLCLLHKLMLALIGGDSRSNWSVGIVCMQHMHFRCNYRSIEWIFGFNSNCHACFNLWSRIWMRHDNFCYILTEWF